MTSRTFQGNLGGLEGADGICQTHAQLGALPGTYKAWLSDETGSPAIRFTQFDGDYVLPSGSVVAHGWSDLGDLDPWTGTALLQHAIDEDELGLPVAKVEDGPCSQWYPVWTNTLPDGTPHSMIQHCDNWRSSGAWPATWGDARSLHRWSVACSGDPIAGCRRRAYLFCFQQ